MPERVVLLAVDGLDWHRVREGVAAGRLPHLAAMLEAGAHAEVSVRACVPGLAGAESGLNSPTLWTTVATGQYYFRHGVYDFSNAMESVENPPLFESRHVRVPRLWDILTQHDIASLVVGYYVTHPAYLIRGLMISDMFGEIESDRTVCPPAQCDVLARTLGAASYADYVRTIGMIGSEAGVREARGEAGERLRAVAGEALARFTDLTDGEIELLLNTPDNARLRRMVEYRLLYPYVRDDRLHRLFLDRLSHKTWRFATVYYRLIDFVGHGFWTQGHTLPETFERTYGSIVDRAYVWIDECVGQIHDVLGPGDRLVVLSDHGFCATPQTASIDDCDAVWELTYGQHAEPAVLIAAGGPKTGRIDGVTLLDIAPTIIDFLGLPQARAFDGGPVPGLLSSDVPRALSPVEAYPYTPPSGAAGLSEDEQDAVLKRLAALGYVE
ncbi:MAG: alkaline phosphatase family protein [Phycisphaerae bacterium]|nr:alkaline phosphatase family protein [Phycisphaerae bacterium]